MNKYQPLNQIVILCLIAIIVVMGLASIEPLDWGSYLLHQVGTLIFVGMMLCCYKCLNVDAMAFALATLFILIHIIGARYLYSYVPYDAWGQMLFGVSINETFGWERNMYDRLVHFSYGLMLYPMMYQSLSAWFKQASLRQLIFITLLFNLASSSVYELFEWGIAMSLSPEDAESYNGQQGDMWDAHKDMALAFVGGVISGMIAVLINGLANLNTAKQSV